MAADPKRSSALSIVRPEQPVAERGRLLDAAEVAAVVWHGKVSGRWVLAHAPQHARVKLGRRVCFYESDMLRWAQTFAGQASA